MAYPLRVDDATVELTEVLPFEHPFRAFEMYLYQLDMVGFSTDSYVGLPPIYRRAIARRTVHRLKELIPGIGPPKPPTATLTLPPIDGAVPIPPTAEDEVLRAQVYGGREADWTDKVILSCLYHSDGTQRSNPSRKGQLTEEMVEDSIARSRRTSVGSASLCFPTVPCDDLQTTASLTAEVKGEVRFVSQAASIPTHMYDREYQLYLGSGDDNPRRSTSCMSYPDRMPPDIQSHDVLMLIFSFLPAEMPTLLAVGTVCKAWRERSEYLAPHWDLVASNRKDLYWAGREAAIAHTADNEENTAIESDNTSNVLRRLNSVIGNARRLPGNAPEGQEHNDTAAVVAPLFNPENDDNDAEGTDGQDEEDDPADPGAAAEEGGEAVAVIEDPVVAARRKAFFPLLIHSRTDLLSKRYLLMIRDEETRDCIVAMRTLGGIIMTMSVLIAFILVSTGAYFLGKSATAMDTYSTLGVTYFFSVLGLVCCCRIFMIRHWWFPTLDAPFGRPNTDLLVQYWGAVLTLVVGLVMALLCLRLRIVNEQIDAPHFALYGPLQNGLCPCNTYDGPTCTTALSRSPIPSLLTATLPAGLSEYTWASTTAFTYTITERICTEYLNTTCTRNSTVSTSLHFLLAVSNATPTGCGGSSQMPRMFAIQVPSVNSTYVGVSDPLTTLAAVSRGGVVREGNSQDGNSIEIKVPFDSSILDCGFDPIKTTALRTQWYGSGSSNVVSRSYSTSTALLNTTTAGRAAQYLIDNSPEPWVEAAIPIVRWEGDGGVEGLIEAYIEEDGKHPWRAVHITAQFKSFETMKREITGAWAAMLVGGIITTCLLNICYYLTEAVVTRPFSNRNRLLSVITARKVREVVGATITALTLAIANPFAMVGWGAVCGYVSPAREACLMEDGQSATIMILGIFVSVFATIALASFLCSYCRGG